MDQPSPEKPDQLNLLIINKLRWSTKTGEGWSMGTAYPWPAHFIKLEISAKLPAKNPLSAIKL
ncbi:MAG: hypothetical protein WCI48_11640 [Bacteroidota bacterium]